MKIKSIAEWKYWAIFMVWQVTEEEIWMTAGYSNLTMTKEIKVKQIWNTISYSFRWQK